MNVRGAFQSIGLAVAMLEGLMLFAATVQAGAPLLPPLPPAMIPMSSEVDKGSEDAKGMAVPYPSVLLYEKESGFDTALYGYDVAGGGDVNGDGVPDFIIGAPYESPNGIMQAGSAYVYSGLNGNLLFRRDGTIAEEWFGKSVTIIGDVNGDGRADFLVGGPNADPGGFADAGSTYLYSGLNGVLLQQKDGAVAGDNFGWDVAGAGIVNADGVSDYIVGAPEADSVGKLGCGIAYVFSGAGGGLLYRKFGESQNDNFGYAVGGGGDMNTDGRADFIVGAIYADSNNGAAYVYSGLNGTLIHKVSGDSVNDQLGNSVDGAGDINADGRADFLVGAPYRFAGAGAAYIYSGLDATVLRRYDGTTPVGYMGYAVANAGDVDGDGFPDAIVGAPTMDPTGYLYAAGGVFIYSGKDGHLLHESYGSSYAAEYGVSVGGLGDLNGDGKSEFAIGAPTTGTVLPGNGGISYQGRAYVRAWGAFEEITNLADVGNDQGKQIRIQWSHMPVKDAFVQEFAIYRRMDGDLSAKGYDPYDLKSTPPGTWDFVGSIPARGDSVYSAVVPTLRDSTVADGMWWTAYFVSGIGLNPVDHFDSPVDSGYSLDNLAPGAPPNLIASANGADVDLDWQSTSAADFDYYWVYRGTTPGFTLDPSKRIGATSDTAFVDDSPLGGDYYRVTAVDFSGNEGKPSNEASVSACACDCAHDPACDGVTNVFDVTHAVNVAFRNVAAIDDPNPSCPYQTTDVDCNGVTNVFDVTRMVNVAFRNANPVTEFCNPCP